MSESEKEHQQDGDEPVESEDGQAEPVNDPLTNTDAETTKTPWQATLE